MTLSITTYSKMTLIKMTLSIMTYRKMTLIIMGLFVTPSISNTQQNLSIMKHSITV
jgi:hypothetical protein